MKKKIICTVCPMGCLITVDGEGERIDDIQGYGCKRGLEYGTNEFSHPVRILTSTVRTSSTHTPLLPVRSQSPIPKERMMDCMEEIRKVTVDKGVRCYDTIISNICNTGIDIVATGEFL
ncbi:DUF1667 domain-containing protein [Eubacterium sp.]|uniref:DUF1667 domain-containing protein n=1 Tax=Eubacterium sp. TaxID=142586 RepID=UPI002FC9126D